MKYFLKTAIKKSTLTTLTILTSSILLASNGYAHAPELHKENKNAEKPKCEAMQDMDHSKMDMNDPITQAMMKQCMAENHGADTHKDMMDHQETKTEKHEDGGHHGDMKKSH